MVKDMEAEVAGRHLKHHYSVHPAAAVVGEREAQSRQWRYRDPPPPPVPPNLAVETAAVVK